MYKIKFNLIYAIKDLLDRIIRLIIIMNLIYRLILVKYITLKSNNSIITFLITIIITLLYFKIFINILLRE